MSTPIERWIERSATAPERALMSSFKGRMYRVHRLVSIVSVLRDEDGVLARTVPTDIAMIVWHDGADSEVLEVTQLPGRLREDP